MPSAYRPKYPHDCNKCILLGAHIHRGHWWDLYFCPEDTLVARFGPAPEQNHSRSHQDADGRPSLSCTPLNTATTMAIERGLIHETTPDREKLDY